MEVWAAASSAFQSAVRAGADRAVEGTMYVSIVYPAPILLVVNDPAARFRLRDYLAERGYGVAALQSAAEAYQALRDDHFDLLLSEVSIPTTEDGFALAQFVHLRCPDTLMILRSSSRTLESAMRNFIVEFLEKADADL
jgi:DNA-binding NtrC family response regulator